MFASLDSVSQEITVRFQQLHFLAEKYAILTPSILLNDKLECKLKELGHEDIDKEEFFVERKRLQNFVSVAHKETEACIKGPLELLQFIF